MKHFIPFILLCSLILCGCGGAQKNSGPLPVIDLTAQYPQKDIVFQEIADVEYISLNGKDVPLIGAIRVGYIAEDRFILYDFQNGDIFVLEHNGTILSHFNRKGNSGKEYTRIVHIAYDPKKREIYILDTFGTNCILVYTETGTFLRNFPDFSRRNLYEIYDFDDKTLFAYFKPSRPNPDSINHTSPYVFLSKEDGKIESRLPLHFPNRRSTMISFEVGGQWAGISVGSIDFRKYGDEFVIADFSADTLYTLSQKRKLTPILARTPSVFAQDVLVTWGIDVKTDTFLSISTIEYDFEALKQQFRKNQPLSSSKSQKFLYYFKNHEIFVPKFINADWPSKEERTGVMMGIKNVSVRVLQAETLVEALEKGELTGKLKELAKTLDYEDNPVLMVVRYK